MNANVRNDDVNESVSIYEKIRRIYEYVLRDDIPLPIYFTDLKCSWKALSLIVYIQNSPITIEITRQEATGYYVINPKRKYTKKQQISDNIDLEQEIIQISKYYKNVEIFCKHCQSLMIPGYPLVVYQDFLEEDEGWFDFFCSMNCLKKTMGDIKVYPIGTLVAVDEQKEP